MCKNTKNKHINSIQDDFGTVCSDPQEISDVLNTHFSTIGEKLHSSSNIYPGLPSQLNSSFFLKPFTINEIFNLINEIDAKKSVRPEDIPPKFIKMAASTIAPVVTKIFNKCVQENIFPDNLKRACVVPIYKKGDHTLCGNYRPISLISPFAKIFEKCLFAQLNSFLNKHNLIHTNQFGFRQNTTTEMAVSQMYEQFMNNVENGEHTCSVFLDLAKAFDSVDHNVLLSKLYSYGIRGNPYELLKNYLFNRTQYTMVNGCSSSLLPLCTGVPQGSVLGPLFFLLFINDLPTATNLKTTMFADDACLTLGNKSMSSLEEIINKELVNVTNWMEINKLSINIDKTFYMIINKNISKQSQPINIRINNKNIQRVDKVKYLGVILDHKLNWEKHIKNVVTKLSKCMWAICKLKKYTNISTLKMAYFALAYPHIQYCITLWGGAAQKYINPLIIRQKRLVRIMLNKPFTSPSKPLFDNLNILTIEHIYKFQLGKLMYLFNNNLIKLPHTLISFQNLHNYNTRSKSKQNYLLPHVKSNVGVRSFSFAGPKLWNQIPTQIKNCSNFLF